MPPPPSPPPAPAPSEAVVAELVDQELPNYFPDFTAQDEAPAPDDDSEPARIATFESVPASSNSAAAVPDLTPATPDVDPSADDSEGSTQGWRGSNAALTLVRGLEGKAIRVTRKGNGETFAFYAAQRRVSEKAGEPYNARALVRATSPGMYVCLRVQEHGDGIATTTERCAPARPGWRRLALKGKAAGKGHKLVVSIHVMAALGGTSFDVDGFRLG